MQCARLRSSVTAMFLMAALSRCTGVSPAAATEPDERPVHIPAERTVEGSAPPAAAIDGPGCVADFCNEPDARPASTTAMNVQNEPLRLCSTDPLTGFYRDGFCHTGEDDRGVHTVCAVVTQEFLAYTRSRGNDLSTPSPASRFPGLVQGDRWCLCAARWDEARRAGAAPSVDLAASHQAALGVVSMDDLQAHAFNPAP